MNFARSVEPVLTPLLPEGGHGIVPVVVFPTGINQRANLAQDRILRIARTLADLSGAVDIRPNDILEAIQYRSLDGKLFS